MFPERKANHRLKQFMQTDFSIAGHELRAVFHGRRALVIGDVMLDRYAWGKVERVSPEAPVPVLRLDRRTERAGGAANVAMNLAGLGMRVVLCGFVGDDTSADAIRRLLAEAKISHDALVVLTERPTTTKTRVIGGHQQMLRLDEEVDGDVDPAYRAMLIQHVVRSLDGADVVVLSDYAKGVLSAKVCIEIIALARARGIPVVVDPKGVDYDRYRGATAITPNVSELALATGVQSGPIEDLFAAGHTLRRTLDIGMVVLTRGADGLTCLSEEGTTHYPAVSREVFDVSGAGDTVAAVLAAGFASGFRQEDAFHLANVAAGVVVGKVGTAPIDIDSLTEALDRSSAGRLEASVLPLDRLVNRVTEWKNMGERIVFTNGCFDVLHVGHVMYLEAARRQGSRLVVGVNSDASVRRLKGEGRPVNNDVNRARVLAALASVDAVVVFSDDTPIEVIRAVQPDVLVKGADYSEAEVVGAAEVRARGGTVTLVPLVEGASTTAILERIAGK
jgi:D-beta-D-heptose 7-phosphate kinase / D-beta-D-heptose 1-phosphate adenosyltransferase